MYLDHFGLLEAPFSIAPDPRYLYMSERHREALADACHDLDLLADCVAGEFDVLVAALADDAAN